MLTVTGVQVWRTKTKASTGLSESMSAPDSKHFPKLGMITTRGEFGVLC